MTKYIVMSIDVGISNLSYCLMQVESNDHDSTSTAIPTATVSGLTNTTLSNLPADNLLSRISILKWETIRVAPPIVEYKCSGLLKSGKPCTHNAVYMRSQDPPCTGEYVYTCKSHTSKDGIASGLRKPAALQKLDIPALTELYCAIQTETSETFETTELIIPTTKRGLVQQIMEMGQRNKAIKIPKQGAARFTPMHVIGANIIEQMDLRIGNRHIDYVVIENQIGPLATKMKAVQAQLTMYFLMRQNGCGAGTGNGAGTGTKGEDGKNQNQEVQSKGIIEGVSATNKLKDYVCSTADYDARKQSSIDICAMLVTTYFLEYQNTWTQCKKKDDMADSLLQGIWYIRHKINRAATTLTSTKLPHIKTI